MGIAIVTKKRDQLMEALYRKLVIKFRNPFDEGSTDGYVLDIGPHFLLLALIDGDIKFNGYQCLPLKDVKELEVPAKYDEFIVAALRKRKQYIARKPNIKLNSIAELLESANKRFPVVTIYRERVRPGYCRIGRIVGISESALL